MTRPNADTEAVVPAAQSLDAAIPERISVLTYNLYLGAHVGTLLGASSRASLRRIVDRAYQHLQGTDFPARARAFARLVATDPPDVICLQEVALYRREPTGVPGFTLFPNATHVDLDFLEVVRGALKAQGLHYRVAVAEPNEDIELPSRSFGNVRFTDRNAILIAEGVVMEAVDRGRFSTQRRIRGAGFVLDFRRGWTSARLRKGGSRFVVFNPHLDGSPRVKVSQAAELFERASSETLPVIVAGDFNQNPRSSPALARLMKAAGFIDSWAAVGRGNGSTCCNRKALTNRRSLLNGRLDLILSRHLAPRRASIVGATPQSRARSGRRWLWISDHAGLRVDFGPRR